MAEGTPRHNGHRRASGRHPQHRPPSLWGTILYGTTMSFMAVPPPRVRIPPCRPDARLYPKPAWHVGVGRADDWFRNQFGQMEVEAEARLGISAYQLLGKQVEDIPPGSEGLLVAPYFAGERAPIYDSLARGMIIGLTLSHTRRHIYRALLEGVAMSLRHSMDALWASGVPRVQRIVSTAGGTRSEVWTQIVSDVIGMDQDVIVNPVGAPYGNAFMAGYGAGLFNDPKGLRELWAPLPGA